MSDINVSKIASRLIEIRSPIGTEEIENLVDEKFNGKKIPLENMASEIMMMVSELVGKTRGQDYEFMIDLIQTVVDEIQNDKQRP